MVVPAGERVPNEQLRAVRTALGMSQSEFAAALQRAGHALGEPNGANKRLVQKWESGEHADCRPTYRRALRSLTGLPLERLGFVHAPIDPSVDESVARVGGVAVTGALGIPGGDAARSSSGPWDRLRFGLQPVCRADARVVELVESATLSLFDVERHRPARELLGAVERQVDEVAAALPGTSRETLHRRLAVAGGQGAALAGWLRWECGDEPAAQGWWDVASAVARQTVNGHLLACVFTYMSYACAARADDLAGWQLAHTAVAHAGTDARAKAWSASRAAQSAARVGRRREALAELDLAVMLAANLPCAQPDDMGAPWARFFDQSGVWAAAAAVHSRFGEHRAAMEFAGRALRCLRSDEVKGRAMVLAEVASAAALADEIGCAVDCAREAVNLAFTLESATAIRTLRSLVPALATHAEQSSVGELLLEIKRGPSATTTANAWADVSRELA